MTEDAKAPTVYIVITDFNGWAQTKTCLQRLRESDYQDFAVIVVDHGTSDETAEGLSNFPGIIRVHAEADLWWTGATNVGIRKALELGAGQIMLLNNDCYVDPSTIGELVNASRTSAGQVIAPVQLDAETGETLVARVSTCFTLGFPTFVLPYMKKVPPDGSGILATRLIVGGRGVVIPAGVFDAVGLFDEDALPHYAADHDFYLRCREQGIGLFVATRASVAIDNTRTTAARNLGDMKWREFKDSLREPRSHRNVATLVTLFKRHYPIRPLFFVGVFLNLVRYLLSYVLLRILRLVRR